jgi:predicted nucleic acid-binding protein
VNLLDIGQVLGHPFVIGELALGNLRQRDLVLGALQDLPQASFATNEEVRQFIDQHRLYGIGIGYVDAHLLASVRLTTGAALWTRDKRLQAAADKLGLEWRIRSERSR